MTNESATSSVGTTRDATAPSYLVGALDDGLAVNLFGVVLTLTLSAAAVILRESVLLVVAGCVLLSMIAVFTVSVAARPSRPGTSASTVEGEQR